MLYIFSIPYKFPISFLYKLVHTPFLSHLLVPHPSTSLPSAEFSLNPLHSYRDHPPRPAILCYLHPLRPVSLPGARRGSRRPRFLPAPPRHPNPRVMGKSTIYPTQPDISPSESPLSSLCRPVPEKAPPDASVDELYCDKDCVMPPRESWRLKREENGRKSEHRSTQRGLG